jgi:hypothetical protein
MNTSVRQPMAFFHADGMIPAWQQAAHYAGKGGHVATLPELVETRLQTKTWQSPAWTKYFATSSAEYYGTGRSGKRLLIVAHGVGPMATLEGAKRAYGWEYKDRTRNRRGGRITQEEFWKLERGEYGEVSIIDFDSYYLNPSIRNEYPFGARRLSECVGDPLIRARLGEKADEYFLRLFRESQDWRNKEENHRYSDEDISDPYIIENGGAGNAPYPSMTRALAWFEQSSPHMAMGHLLEMEQPMVVHYDGGVHLWVAIKCQEWSDNWSFLAIPDGNADLGYVLNGPDARKLLDLHWEKLLVHVEEPQLEIGMRVLMQFGDEWFTQYPKVSIRMDTGEPEFEVVSKKRIGQPVSFRTSTGGGIFYKYGLDEVVSIAPPGANAYRFTTDPEREGENWFTRMVQFYHVEVNLTQRLMKEADLSRNLDLMFTLMQSSK